MKNFNSYILILFSLLFLNIGFGQKKNAGFYGKRFYIQADGVFSFPVFAALFNVGNNYTYIANGDKLQIGSDKFNYGYRVSAGYSLKRNFAIGLEVGHDYSNAGVYGIVHEMLDISTLVVVPKIELAHENALLPMGISHHIGIGAEWSSIVDRNYLLNASDPFTGNTTTIHYNDLQTNELPFGEINNIPSIKRYILMYDITMRNPISKNLFITYGFKYVLKFKSENQEAKLVDSPNYSYYLNEINFSRNTNIISFHLGLTLAL